MLRNYSAARVFQWQRTRRSNFDASKNDGPRCFGSCRLHVHVGAERFGSPGAVARRRHGPECEDWRHYRGSPLSPPRVSPLGRLSWLPRLWVSPPIRLWIPPPVLLRRLWRVRISVLLPPSPGLRHLPRLL